MSHEEVIIGKHKFKIHSILKSNLDILKRENKKDWDFKIIISGDGMTRIGKTTLAGQIGLYLDENMVEQNWCYDGSLLRTMGVSIGKGKCMIYDEAKSGLDSKRAMQKYSQNIVDYFNECGYLNQFLIIILPDFFDLNKSVALNLSVFLLNVTTNDEMQRGYFDFYSRRNKRILYIKGKKFYQYERSLRNFSGTFTNYFPFDYKELEKIKQKMILKDSNEKLGKLETRYKARLERAIVYLYYVEHWKQDKIGMLFSTDNDQITQDKISKIIGKSANYKYNYDL